jgi:peroxidase
MKTYVLLFFISSTIIYAQENRSFDGLSNNIAHPEWGASQTFFRNYVTNGFADLISEPGGQDRENPRVISNAFGSQDSFMQNELGLSDFVWGWGQFIDHDINLNDDNFSEAHNIAVPDCDAMFDPECSGTVNIRMFRSLSEPTTGTDISNPRKHINEITSFIDGSGVYGSNLTRANWLRSNINGKLKTSLGNLLPWNTVDGNFDSAIDSTAPFMALDGFPIPEKYFVGGDIRINEQPGLTAFHTLWLREHNRLCDELKTEHPTWSDEALYQRARKMVGAFIEAVTYEEFLPNIGVHLDPYVSYDNTIEPNILNAFSAAGYRFGHTMVNGRLIRYDEDGTDWSFGAIDLRNGFFNPTILKDEGGIEPFFRGLAAQKHQLVDPRIMDDIRNFLFGPPGAGGLDLLSINIARGRERGLPDFNTLRTDLGLAPYTDFIELTSDIDLSGILSSTYNADINTIDPWIGFMSEDHLSNAIVGEGLDRLLKLQFGVLRDGDRYYYENDAAFTEDDILGIKSTKLSEIILRNTAIETLQENVFIAVPRSTLAVELFPFPEFKSLKLNAYPNPIQKYFNLVIDSRHASSANLRIFNIQGLQVFQSTLNIQQGKHEYPFELSDELASGLYVISLESEQGQGQLKVIKER